MPVTIINGHSVIIETCKAAGRGWVFRVRDSENNPISDFSDGYKTEARAASAARTWAKNNV